MRNRPSEIGQTKSALIINRMYDVRAVADADITYRYDRLHLPQQMPRSRVRVHDFLSMSIICLRFTHLLYNSYQYKTSPGNVFKLSQSTFNFVCSCVHVLSCLSSLSSFCYTVIYCQQVFHEALQNRQY